MVAHAHGEIWNSSGPARSLGTSEPTIRRYLDLMTDLFMVRQLAPWHENLKKRQVKRPKVYFRDSGLLPGILGLETERDLLSHPKAGASWEGYAIEETLRTVKPDEAYFWATHQGAELDLLLFKNGRRLGVEVKRSDAPRLTRSMRIAQEDLDLERMIVLYPGTERYSLDAHTEVIPLTSLPTSTVAGLFGRQRRRGR